MLCSRPKCLRTDWPTNSLTNWLYHLTIKSRHQQGKELTVHGKMQNGCQKLETRELGIIWILLDSYLMHSKKWLRSMPIQASVFQHFDNGIKTHIETASQVVSVFILLLYLHVFSECASHRINISSTSELALGSVTAHENISQHKGINSNITTTWYLYKKHPESSWFSRCNQVS